MEKSSRSGDHLAKSQGRGAFEEHRVNDGTDGMMGIQGINENEVSHDGGTDAHGGTEVQEPSEDLVEDAISVSGGDPTGADGRTSTATNPPHPFEDVETNNLSTPIRAFHKVLIENDRHTSEINISGGNIAYVTTETLNEAAQSISLRTTVLRRLPRVSKASKTNSLRYLPRKTM